MIYYDYSLKLLDSSGNVISVITQNSTQLRQVTINNLTNGTVYRFYVTTRNGNSSASIYDAFVDVMPTTISYSVNPLRGARTNSTVVTLSWDPPTSTGGSDITSYLIVWYSTGDLQYITLEGDARSYVFPNAVDAIHAAIFAINSFGASPISNTVVV
jgi:hypothetical protein